MANEYLRRTPTSTGNRRVWTWSAWIKRASNFSIGEERIWTAGNGGGSGTDPRTDVGFGAGNFKFDINSSGSSWNAVTTTPTHRDPSSWSHIMFVIDTTQTSLNEQRKIFFNGVRELLTSGSALSSNELTPYNLSGYLHVIGSYVNSLTENPFKGEMVDVFFVDGQALTPDVFGFYKQGKGYISAGSTQATDFRPGQWVPKTPRVIKTEINRRGGFGVNGFYLPMNDSKNFGADFHGEPNSIITLNEKLPQPRVGVATTASVGLGYTDALRADPYAANLVLALPFVSSGLSTGTDYAPYIKGSGTAKTITNNGVSIASTASHYGSAAFFNGSTQYLSIADSDDFNFGSGNFTIECWVNPSTTVNTTSYRRILSQQVSANWIFRLDNQGVFQTIINDGTNSYSITSGARIDTLGQWTHLAWVRNGTTLTNYINGVAVGIQTGVTTTIPDISNTVEVGRYVGGTEYYAGYLQDLRIYKGVAKYTTGFDVPKPYTPVGIATWRAVPDCTANNFATLNAIDNPNSFTLTNGNLTGANATSNHYGIKGTVGFPTTGKYYYELRVDSYNTTPNYAAIGVAVTSPNLSQGQTVYLGTASNNILGSINNAGTETSIGTNPSDKGVGTILQVAYDAGNRNLWIGANNTYYSSSGANTGNPSSGTNATATGITTNAFPSINLYNATASINFGQNPTFSGNTTAGTFTDSNGKGLFKYQPPSGFLALCEDNLPTPAISNPGQYFKTVIYTGDGNNGRSIVGVGFTPDLVWIKNRSNAASHIINDSVRGAGFNLFSNSTAAENGSGGVGGDLFQSFNSDGFAINPTYAGASNNGTNASGQTYAAWCWRAGAGTTTTNTNGSIPSVVSVNQDAGFSIVSYRGTGANATVGHGLGKAPSFMVFKQRNQSDGWLIYHKSITARNFLQWDTDASAPLSTAFNNTEPTSSVFSVGTLTNANDSGWPIIAYCWAEIEGFSKFGSYVGNGNADGPMVWCGFKPAWIMIKRTAGAADWVIHDSSRTSVNPSDTILRPNTNDIDLTAATLNVDFLSNGFKIRNTNGSYNNAETYIFAAFAESPINYSNSK